MVLGRTRGTVEMCMTFEYSLGYECIVLLLEHQHDIKCLKLATVSVGGPKF